MPASFPPFSLAEDMAEGAIDFDTHSFKIMLLTGSYSPNQAHDRRNDVEANEVSGTGYTAGGQSITVSSVSRSNGTTTITFSSPITWTGADGFTAAWACIYRAVGGSSSGDPIASTIYNTGDQTANGQDFIFTITSPLTITVPTVSQS